MQCNKNNNTKNDKKHFLGYSSRHYWCPARIPLALTIPVCKDGISLQVRATLCFGLLPMAINQVGPLEAEKSPEVPQS